MFTPATPTDAESLFDLRVYISNPSGVIDTSALNSGSADEPEGTEGTEVADTDSIPSMGSSELDDLLDGTVSSDD